MRFFLSLLILLHLFVIFSLPNSNSYLQNTFGNFLQTYGNFLNISYTWQFFSPDPASAMYYIYEISDMNQVIKEGIYPEKGAAFSLRAIYTRRTAVKNYLARDPDLALKLLGDYLCRTTKEAYSVRIRTKVIQPVTLKEAQGGMALNNTSKKFFEPIGEYHCNRGEELSS